MGKTFLTFEQAESMLPVGDEIHTFRNPSGMLIGADWSRKDILKLLKTGKPQLGGDMAQKMGHGIVCEDKDGYVFVATAVTAQEGER